MCSVVTYLVEWSQLLRDRGHQRKSAQTHLEGEETLVKAQSTACPSVGGQHSEPNNQEVESTHIDPYNNTLLETM